MSTDTEKLTEVTRELAVMIRRFPGQIARGEVTHVTAQFRIKVMRDIALDYQKRIEQQKPQLPLDSAANE